MNALFNVGISRFEGFIAARTQGFQNYMMHKIRQRRYTVILFIITF